MQTKVSKGCHNEPQTCGPGGTLSNEAPPEAVQVEDVVAGQLLVAAADDHVLAAHDAGVVRPLQLLLCGVREPAAVQQQMRSKIFCFCQIRVQQVTLQVQHYLLLQNAVK